MAEAVAGISGVTREPPPQLVPGHPKEGAGAEPIAIALGIDYPFPPHLEYAYPPPDGNILTNIVGALIAVPRFYTQVLHLMNKMNLPPPFRPALPTPPLPPSAAPLLKRQLGDLSSGESELESEEESETVSADIDDNNPEDIGKKDRAKKRTKKEPILGPAADKGASHEAAGVKSVVIPKFTAIKKKAPVLQIKIVPPKTGMSEVEKERNKAEETEQAARVQDVNDDPTTASREELEAGKIQASEMLSLSIFKKYDPGNPAPVLYIKNLAKDVVAEDMYYIFGAFFSSKTEAMENLSVKVMQEGKMRGQAFVWWPSTELAKAALAGTHGYMFKGKPMIVQYGHNLRQQNPPRPAELTQGRRRGSCRAVLKGQW